jgi:poly-gamma-glutamate synthesis protein (capsule biosynthesis protein)
MKGGFPQSVVTLFLCGDIMTGRGIDQVLPHSAPPKLFEPYMRDARDYVALAERVNGPIPRQVAFDYIWGDALGELRRRAPDAKIINLETSITAGGKPWPGKGIHYRMHPSNLPLITTAGIDVCVLANNHILDWGYRGLIDALDALANAGIRTAGAGRDRSEAEAPAMVDLTATGRVLVFSCGARSSGIPDAWAATADHPGVNLLPDLSMEAAGRIGTSVQGKKSPGDVVVVSIHWGGNWGYAIPAAHRQFARLLIDRAGVDLVHGHSSHHPIGMEVYRGKLILYGCGDLVTDYEGIAGYEAFRGDLGLMYFVRLDRETGNLAELEMVPMRMRRFRLSQASRQDAGWLSDTLNREGQRLGSRVEMKQDGTLVLRWTPTQK